MFLNRLKVKKIMRNLNNKFENKKINYEELLQYGFKKEKINIFIKLKYKIINLK